MTAELELRRHIDAMRRLQEVCLGLNAVRDLSATFQAVVDGVVGHLGFGAAAINVVRGDVVEVAAVAGSEELRAALEGTTGTRAAWDELLGLAEHWGPLRFIAHDADERPAGVPTWTPPAAPPDQSDAWHPEDALVAPLYSSTGELVGILSVDLPVHGRRPDAFQRELLGMFAAQAAIAVDNARLQAELREEQAALRASEESFRQAFKNAPSGMAMRSLRVGDNYRLFRVNAALCAMLGYSAEQLKGTVLASLVHPDDRALLPDGDRSYQGDLRLLHRDGRVVWVSMNSSIVPDPAGAPDFHLIHVQDVSERRYREEQLAHLAAHDPLTGLPNRLELYSRLRQLLADQTRLAVLFCDLDHFKQINDKYGHEAGDALLVEVTERLRAHVRAHDTVARIGGDEFVVVVREISAADAVELARQIADDIARPVRLGEYEDCVLASIGVAATDVPTTVDELLRVADQAMYWVKTARRAGEAMLTSGQ